ncbi:MAG: HAMP domain-containing protein [Rhodospirillaceae bacterium]|jgi:methyl-accepting chemotaxis protein|nr:HAMP domain-containing protein [Rhodospirillaceae bacterium]
MLRISTKFPFVIVALSLLAAFVTGLVAYRESSSELQLAAKRQLTALVETRRSNLNTFINSVTAEIELLAGSKSVKQAMLELDKGWKELGPVANAHLIRHYISENKRENKALLSDPGDGSRYSAAHRQFHPDFRKTLKSFAYHDVFLINLDGNLLYTVVKEIDFASNLLSGQWQNTNLAHAFQAAIRNPNQTTLVFEDFENYQPSLGRPAAFLAKPIIDDEQQTLGILAIQLPIERLNKIMQATAGMGKSGETYIVGPDLLMRSDSRFSKQSTILKTKVDTLSVSKALKKKAGVHIVKDYRGISVLSAYTPLRVVDTNWAVLAEIDEAEVLAPIKKMQDFMIIAGIIIGIIIAILGTIFARHLSNPIKSIALATQKLANDELNTEIPSMNRSDEIGELARAVKTFKDRAQNSVEMEQALEIKEAQLQEVLNRMSDGLLLIGNDLNVEVYNNKVEQLLELPDGFLTPGTSIRKILEFQAERGDFGAGNIDELVDERLNQETEYFIEESISGRFLEFHRHFTPKGVLVVFNDITEQTRANDELNQKIDELEMFNKMAIGRELKMIELKSTINKLLEEKGDEAMYEEIDGI